PSFSPRLHLPSSFFLFTPPPPPALYTLSLHDALPIYADPSLPIADGHERVEPEAPAALDDFGDAVDRDHVLDETIPFALPLATVAALAAPPWPAPPATAAPPTATTPPTPPTPATSTTPTPAPSAARLFLDYRLAARVRRFGFFALARAPRRRHPRRRGLPPLRRPQNPHPPSPAPPAPALPRPRYRSPPPPTTARS